MKNTKKTVATTAWTALVLKTMSREELTAEAANTKNTAAERAALTAELARRPNPAPVAKRAALAAAAGFKPEPAAKPHPADKRAAKNARLRAAVTAPKPVTVVTAADGSERIVTKPAPVAKPAKAAQPAKTAAKLVRTACAKCGRENNRPEGASGDCRVASACKARVRRQGEETAKIGAKAAKQLAAAKAVVKPEPAAAAPALKVAAAPRLVKTAKR